MIETYEMDTSFFKCDNLRTTDPYLGTVKVVQPGAFKCF